MRAVSADDTKLKNIFKKAIIEVLQERRELVTELIEEAIEDEGMAFAIQEGAQTKSVSRAQVMKALRSRQ